MPAPERDSATPPRSLVDRSAAYVLECALKGTDVAARRRALGRVDPLARRDVELRVRSLLGDAEFEAPEGSEAHRVCLAILELHGVSVDDPRDPVAVTERVASIAKPASAPRWTRSLSVVAVVLIAVAVAFGVQLGRPKPFEALTLEDEETRSAYRTGGRPVHDAAIDPVLAGALETLTVAARRAGETGAFPAADFERVQADLRAPDFVRALSSHPAAALDRVVAAYRAFVEAGTGDAAAVAEAVRRFDESCVARGLGYRIDAYPLSGGRIALATNSVEKVRLVGSGSTTRRILLVRRLDRLNVLHPALGYLEAGVAVIPIESVDRFAIEVLLPLLEREPHPSLIDPQVSIGRYPWLVPTHASAAAVVRRSLGAAGCREVDELAALLAERRTLFGGWSAHLAQFGVTVVTPDTFEVDVDALRESAGSRLPRFRELETIQDTLGERGPSGSFGCVRDVIAAELAQQAVELGLAPDPRADEPRPPSLVALVDPAQTMDAEGFRTDPNVARSRGAFARIERSPSPGITLTFMLRCYTHGGTCTHANEVATVFAFTELAREMRLASFVEPDRAGSSAVAAIFRDLATKSDAEVTRAAGAAFRRLFGCATPTLAAP